MSTQELYKELFGTPSPSPAFIRRWQREWADSSDYTVKCTSRVVTQRRLKELDIDPLLAVNRLDHTTTQHQFTIVFYREEDYLAYKMTFG